MRVLVCGSRTWDDEFAVDVVLAGIEYATGGGMPTLIHGAARGADSIAAKIADECHYPILEYPAEWNVHGRSAGPIRNQQMLTDGKPDMVWAFSDDIANSKGTRDMVERAAKAGLPVYVVSRVRATASAETQAASLPGV